MKFQLPEDYKSFCKQIGPGTAGRVKVFSYVLKFNCVLSNLTIIRPQGQLCNPDPRIHHYRLQNKFQQKEFIVYILLIL